MSSNFDDTVKAEIDRRKIQKLIDDGVITADEIANAPIIDTTEETTDV